MNANKKFWLVALTFLLITVIFVSTMGVVFWERLSFEEKNIVSNVVHPRHLIALCAPLLIGLLLAVYKIYKLYIFPLGKLAEEMTLMHTANPSHRINISGCATLQKLAVLINASAERYQELDSNVKEKIAQAKAQVEDEKNTLAAFISELSEGVVICNPDGRILLYNRQAKEFLSGNGTEAGRSVPYIGLGRSVFGLIDKDIIVHALDEITAKLKQKDDAVVSYFVIVGNDNRQLKTEAVPIIDADKRLTGFILILYDITHQLETDNKVDILLKSLMKDLRSSLGGLRAAIETIIAFPDMDRDKRAMFKTIIHKESITLSEVIEKTELQYSEHIHTQWPLIQIPAADLVESVKSKAKEKLNIAVDFNDDTSQHWINVDKYSLVLAMLFMLHRVSQDSKSHDFSYCVKRARKFVNIDLIWRGEPVKIEKLREWDDMAPVINNETLSHSLKEVIKHHEAEIIPYTLPESAGLSSLRLLLPATDLPETPKIIRKNSIKPHQHLELYEFDLFNQSGQNAELDNTPLSDLVYTVFDTETTGLDPSGGDEIVSLAAVRIVNMRILHEEMIDQLIDPKRPIPAVSIEIHGIGPEMLEGQPIIDTILPQLHKFAEETILIGHNAAFDMAMFKAKERQTGIKFSNPVLDTLLLSAVVHPEQESHAIEAITDRLGVSMIGRHSAFGDALTTAEIFLKIIPLLTEKGIHTLKEAREASQRTFYAKLKY
ncbi:MAG: exonuclease domain-containing protein [Pseudomonadota bacterium]